MRRSCLGAGTPAGAVRPAAPTGGGRATASPGDNPAPTAAPSRGHPGAVARTNSSIFVPSPTGKEGPVEPRKEKKGRFGIVKLEARIAPAPPMVRIPSTDV